MLFLVAFDMHAQTPLLAPYLNLLGVSAALIGFVLGGYAVSNLAGNLIAGPFLDRFPKKWFIAGGLIFAGFMLIGQGVVTHTGSFFAFRLMLGFVMAFVSPACSAMLGETGRTALEQGEIMGKKGLVLTTAGIVSPAVGSFFAVQFGYGQSFVILGYIMIVAGVFSWLALPSKVAGGMPSEPIPKAEGRRSLLTIMENRMLYPAFFGRVCDHVRARDDHLRSAIARAKARNVASRDRNFVQFERLGGARDSLPVLAAQGSGRDAKFRRTRRAQRAFVHSGARCGDPDAAHDVFVRRLLRPAVPDVCHHPDGALAARAVRQRVQYLLGGAVRRGGAEPGHRGLVGELASLVLYFVFCDGRGVFDRRIASVVAERGYAVGRESFLQFPWCDR